MNHSALLENAVRSMSESVFVERLGCELVSFRIGRTEVRMPYNLRNSNRSGTMHGGAIASLALIASNIAAAESQRGDDVDAVRPLHLSIAYLAAPREEELIGIARVVQRGRDTAHVTAEIRSGDGRPIANAWIAERLIGSERQRTDPGARVEEADTPRPVAAGFRRFDEHAATRVGGSAFLQAAEIAIYTEASAWSCARLPVGPNEGVAGTLHDGAIATLADSCAAYSSYAATGVPDSSPSATVAMSLGFAVRRPGPLCCASRLVARMGNHFSNQVEVFEPSDGRVTAFGTVSYRILGSR